jgi:hypothetical protein
MVANLKDSMLKYLFSKTESKNSEMLNKSKLLNTLMGMEQNEALGGKDFGNYGKGLSSVFDDSSQDLKNEISDFMLDETEETFVKNTINNKDSKTLSQELGKLQKFCSDAGVQINNRALMKRINSAIDDIGLAHFIPPENTKQSFSFSEGDQRGKQPQEAPMIYLSKEEQLVDRLRQLYFQKALNPGIKANFELYFKIRTTKNNLIKIGAVDKDTERRLEAEAQLLAKEKLLDDLYKVFIEQATLQKLEGPTYDILRNRKAFLIKSLHKIGYKIREDEINRIRDRANSEIFPIIKEQLHKIEMLADINQSIQATRQRKILIETLTRIKEESKLSESIDTNLNFEDSGFVERTVVEAA